MVKESESFKQNAEGKNKAHKRKKDEASNDTSSKEDRPSASKKIVLSYSCQEKHQENVKTPKIKTVSKNNAITIDSKTVSKNNAIKKVAKKFKAKVQNSEGNRSINDSLSEATLEISETVINKIKVDEKSTCVNSVQTEDDGSSIITIMGKNESSRIIANEDSSMKTNVHFPSCEFPFTDNKTDEVPCKDETSLKRKCMVKELSSTEIPKEFNISETSVIQIISFESLRDTVSLTSETNQNSTPEKMSNLIKKNSSNEPEEQKPKNDDCKPVSNKQNSSQNDTKSDILSEPITCYPLLTQVTLVQDHESLLNINNSNQNAVTQHEKSNEYKCNDNYPPNDSDPNIDSNNKNPCQNLDPSINSNSYDPCQNLDPNINSNNKNPCQNLDPNINSNNKNPCQNLDPNINSNNYDPCQNLDPNINSNNNVPCQNLDPNINSNNDPCKNSDLNINSNNKNPCQNLNPSINSNSYDPCQNLDPNINSNNKNPCQNLNPSINSNNYDPCQNLDPNINSNNKNPCQNLDPNINSNNDPCKNSDPNINSNNKNPCQNLDPNINSNNKNPCQNLDPNINSNNDPCKNSDPNINSNNKNPCQNLNPNINSNNKNPCQNLNPNINSNNKNPCQNLDPNINSNNDPCKNSDPNINSNNKNPCKNLNPNINFNNNDPCKNSYLNINSNNNDVYKDSNSVIDSNKHPEKAEPVSYSNGKLIDPVAVVVSNENNIESFVLKAALKENNKEKSIPKSNENIGSNQPPESSHSFSEQFKEPIIFDDDDDSDVTDSQLCETEWTLNRNFLSENAHFKKNDFYLTKVKKAKTDGSQIVNELITELSQLNKRLLHFKREMDAVCKRRKITQMNVAKKRTPVQTVLGQFR